MFPRGDTHLLSNGCETEVPLQTSQANERILAHDLNVLRAGGGGETTRFVCGFMACDRRIGRPIFSSFPSCFKVNVRTDASGSVLENSILHLVAEAVSGRPGAGAVLSKLSEALFFDVLRRYVDSIPQDQSERWLAGIRDPIVGHCLSLLHGRVDHSWTLADLAKEAGVSRSALAERFTRFLAEPPMTYLTRWRLQLAARALSSSSKGVVDIAASVGYESEAAFTRAFKREYGIPPARYRREMRLTQSRRTGFQSVGSSRASASRWQADSPAAPLAGIRRLAVLSCVPNVQAHLDGPCSRCILRYSRVRANRSAGE